MIAATVRNDFAGQSTGSNYFDSKGSAINRFDSVLRDAGIMLSEDAWVDYNGPIGRANHPICDEFGHEVGCAVFSWHKMPSGRYEFIGYIA